MADYSSPKQNLVSREINTLTITENDKSFTYGTIEYPIGELGGTKYPHFMIFYINDTIKGNLTTDIQPNWTPNGRTAGTSTSQVVTGAAGGQIGKNLVAALTSATNSMITTYNTATIAAGASGTLTPKVETIDPTATKASFSSAKKRLKKCIMLPMPQHVRANYSADYTTTEAAGAFGAIISSAVSKDATSSGIAKTALFAGAPLAASMASKVLGNIADNLVNGGGEIVKGVTPSAAQVTQILSKMSGRILNKRQEQLFNNMNFRTHQFTYLFLPRNENESNAITSIITTFKTYMHPDIDEGTGSSLLITPAEFDIDFRSGTNINQSISKVATCALVGCDVNYTAVGEFIAFETTSNPVAIQLDLTFKELEPLVRSMVSSATTSGIGGY